MSSLINICLEFQNSKRNLSVFLIYRSMQVERLDGWIRNKEYTFRTRVSGHQSVLSKYKAEGHGAKCLLCFTRRNTFCDIVSKLHLPGCVLMCSWQVAYVAVNTSMKFTQN